MQLYNRYIWKQWINTTAIDWVVKVRNFCHLFDDNFATHIHQYNNSYTNVGITKWFVRKTAKRYLSSYLRRKSHCVYKPLVRSSHLHNGISCSFKHLYIKTGPWRYCSLALGYRYIFRANTNQWNAIKSNRCLKFSDFSVHWYHVNTINGVSDYAS